MGGSQENRWYVARTKPGRELLANLNLEDSGFEPYLPMCVERMDRRKISTRESPMFPGYIFVPLDIERSPWGKIYSVVGVMTLISHDHKPVPIPKGVIESIQDRLALQGGLLRIGPPPFERGELLRVTGGHFEGLDGLYVYAAHDRVTLLLDMMGRTMAVTVLDANIARLDAHIGHPAENRPSKRNRRHHPGAPSVGAVRMPSKAS